MGERRTTNGSASVFTLRLRARCIQQPTVEVMELARRANRAVRTCPPLLGDLIGGGPVEP
ncbi:hypothetical protein [Streptomyces aquilus]|uniref:hypothetical protein n=1 Tax=Streptomyces aquilus TaxID=2548456 RepID=UPI0036C95614